MGKSGRLKPKTCMYVRICYLIILNSADFLRISGVLFFRNGTNDVCMYCIHRRTHAYEAASEMRKPTNTPRALRRSYDSVCFGLNTPFRTHKFNQSFVFAFPYIWPFLCECWRISANRRLYFLEKQWKSFDCESNKSKISSSKLDRCGWWQKKLNRNVENTDEVSFVPRNDECGGECERRYLLSVYRLTNNYLPLPHFLFSLSLSHPHPPHWCPLSFSQNIHLILTKFGLPACCACIH